LLKPGRKVLVAGIGSPQPMTFVRRDRACCGQPAVNVFQCDEYRGLNGPEDKGICTMSDYRVSRFVEVVQ
jgi:hypothetical protein